MAAVAGRGFRSPSTAHDLTMIASSCCKLAAFAAFSLTSDHKYKSPASSEWRRRRPQPQQGPPQFMTFFALSRSKTHLTFGSRRMRELYSARAMLSIVKLKIHIKSSSFCFGESQGREAMLAVVVLYQCCKLHCPSSPPPPPPARVSHPQPVQTLPLKSCGTHMRSTSTDMRH